MSYDLLFRKGVELFENGQFNDAEQIFRQVLETAPEHPEVLNMLGLTAQAMGAQSEACALFSRAIKKDPGRADFYFNLGFSLKLDKRPREALQCFQKVAELRPETAEAYDESALLYQHLGNLGQARLLWEKALAINPALSSAAANLAYSYRTENPGRAAAELEKITERFPDEPAAWYYLAQISLALGKDAEAWRAAGKAKALAPLSDEVRVVLGKLALRENKIANARIYFEKAVLLNDRNEDALLNSANIASRENDFETAESRYRRVLELNTKNFDAHHNYAEMLFRQKRTAEALEEYRQAVILNPQSAEASNNLGSVLRELGEFEEALGLYFNAFKLNPLLEEAALNIFETITLYGAEKPDQAREIAQNWLKLAPDNVFAKRLAAALRGEKVADNQVYTEKLFDHFADHYELVVKDIGYAVPLALGRIAGVIKGSVVDLGCGTGLVGEVIKNAGNHLTGVDLSQKMLAEAAKKGRYDRLVKADAVAFLEQNPGFDWVVAADVAGYLGNLEPLIKAAVGSRFLFSTEIYEGDEGYVLGFAGRYSHSPSYVENLLKSAGFQSIFQEELVLRKENNQDVRGILWKAE